MTQKTKAPPRPAKRRPKEVVAPVPVPVAPGTIEDRLRAIDELKEQIVGHAGYIAKVVAMTGTSSESKERAVAAFYDRMVVFERQLSRIRDDLQLG